MRLDFTFVLWVGSLILSAAAVVLFLWLMREQRDAEPPSGRAEPPEVTEGGNALRERERAREQRS